MSRSAFRRLMRPVVAVPLLMAASLAVGILAAESDVPGGLLPWTRPAGVSGGVEVVTTALQKLQAMRPDLNGWSQQAMTRQQMSELRDDRGNLTARFDGVVDVWVIRFTAPEQLGYAVNEATILIDVQSGEVRSAVVNGWNPG